MAITSVLPTMTFPKREDYLDPDEWVTQAETAYDVLSGVFTTNTNLLAIQANALEANVNAKELSATTAATSASTSALIAQSSANYKGDWVSGYATTGYSLGMSVSFIDGLNYVSKVNNNLATPITKTNTTEWNYIEVVGEDEIDSINNRIDNISTDPTKAEFMKSVSYGSEFTVPYSGANTALVSIYKETPSVDVTSNTFSADASSLVYDDTKLDVVADGLQLKDLGGGTYTINEYIPATSSTPIDTSYWTNIDYIQANSVTNSQEIYYSFSFDEKTTWNIFKAGESPRNIVRNNLGTWEYNSNVTYGLETWTTASVNTQDGALSEAMSVVVNRMDGTIGIEGWALGNAVYNSNFNVTTQDAAPHGIAFNPDGTKMYIVGSVNDSIYQYNLSTPWTVTTAVYNSVFSVAAQDTNPRGISFSSDGTKMFIVGLTGESVKQYNLSTPWTVTTAVYNSNFIVTEQDTNPIGITFNPDGTKMYIVGSTGKDVNQYNLSTPWTVTTAVYNSVFSVAAQDTTPYGIAFNPDGTKMYIVGSVKDSIYQYNLSTPWTVTTAVYNSVFSVAAQDTNPIGISFSSDGTKMFIVGGISVSVYQYNELSIIPIYPSLTDTLDTSIILKSIDVNTTPIYYDNSLKYDGSVVYESITDGVDYNVKLVPSGVNIRMKTSGNIKGRIV